MQVRVMGQVGSPTVQYGEETDLSPQMPRIGGNGFESFGAGSEENAIDYFFVLVGNRGNLLRHGKDDVKIGHFQKLGLAVLNPLGAGQRLAFGAMPIPAG